jgi:hypothetical protein
MHPRARACWCTTGRSSPARSTSPAFAALVDRAGGAVVALEADHAQTCREAYSGPEAYARLLGAS